MDPNGAMLLGDVWNLGTSRGFFVLAETHKNRHHSHSETLWHFKTRSLAPTS